MYLNCQSWAQAQYIEVFSRKGRPRYLLAQDFTRSDKSDRHKVW